MSIGSLSHHTIKALIDQEPAVRINIHDGPLLVRAHVQQISSVGAVISFEGLVRSDEDGRTIKALFYEMYNPMAENILYELAVQAKQKFNLIGIHVEHSRGKVMVGLCSFRLNITSKHRKKALTAMDWYIDQMKIEAPIWKRPIWIDQEQKA
ncbi:molybdenum cofactor biosynthesis protein MoaE [Planctomycetota bacterium]|nr:molybdenum cofactor biosynthesis protein MoaE [Planctomycetota bacterium]